MNDAGLHVRAFGHHFSWLRDFKYEGKADTIGLNYADQLIANVIGCYFLSGRNKPTTVIFSRHDESYPLSVSFNDGVMKVGAAYPIEHVCLCGPDVADPSFVTKFCTKHSPTPVYVCPLIDELPAFGMLAIDLLSRDKERPRRVDLSIPFDEPLDFASEEFDPKLEGDGLGRMAEIVGRRKVGVLNQMRMQPGISPFYGSLIGRPGDGYIVSCDSVLRYFNRDPVNMSLGAATCVPVRMTPTHEFRKLAGDDRKEVDVFVSSSYVNGLSTFMRFLKIMSGRDFIGFTYWKSSDVDDAGVVFRYSRGWHIPGKLQSF